MATSVLDQAQRYFSVNPRLLRRTEANYPVVSIKGMVVGDRWEFGDLGKTYPVFRLKLPEQPGWQGLRVHRLHPDLEDNVNNFLLQLGTEFRIVYKYEDE